MNKTELMLQEIQWRGGMTFTECQRFMVELKHGPGSYDREWQYGAEEVYAKNKDGTFKLTKPDQHGFQHRIVLRTRGRRWRRYRGHYSGTLCGCKNYDGRRRPKDAGPGSVLEKWCVRGPDRKYRIRPGLMLEPPYHPMEWPGERYTRMVQAKCRHRFQVYPSEPPIKRKYCFKCSMWEVEE